jgi:hypothetical protein
MMGTVRFPERFQRRRTTRAIVGSPSIACFSRYKAEPDFSPFAGEVSWQLPNYPGRSEPSRVAPVETASVDDVGKNVMKALSSLGRNDVIRATALVAIVVFPLIAHAQLGRGSGAVKISHDVSPVAGAPVRTAAIRGSCADQHWPFFSAECLRQSTPAVEPRLVSMNVEPSANSATTGDAPKAVPTADIVRDNGPSVGPKKTAKPRIASHRRERRTTNVNYAANMSMPGW